MTDYRRQCIMADGTGISFNQRGMRGLTSLTALAFLLAKDPLSGFSDVDGQMK